MRCLLPVSIFALLAISLTAQDPSTIKKGPWRDGDTPEGWTRLLSGRYEFQSNAPPERVKIVAKHLNAVNDHYSKTFPSARTPNKPFTVKVFKNREQFLAYGAPPSSGAYYSWVDKEMVGYDTGKLDGVVDTPGTTGPRKRTPLDALRDRFKMDMLGVFAHEGWHQYFHWWCTSKVSFPSWCDEGIGEYFYTARIRDGKVVLGALNDYRLGTIKAAVKRKKHIPLKDLVTYDQQKYYDVADLAYAQGWSFVHFLLEHPDYKKQRYLQRFLKVFVDEHAIENAVSQVFGRMDWPKTEADWIAWVLAMKIEGKPEAEKSVEEAVDEARKATNADPLDPEGEGKPLPTPPGPPTPPVPPDPAPPSPPTPPVPPAPVGGGG